MSRYEWLLLLHVLSAFALVAATVVFTTLLATGPRPELLRLSWIGSRLWDVGGLGTLVLGIWLALYLDEYDFFEGWILGAIGLWLVATGLGQSTQRRIAADAHADIAAMHWLRTLAVLGLLVLMIWKPGA